MTSLDKEKFYPLFGDWWPKIEPFFLSGGFDSVYQKLKFDAKRGVKIAPLSHNVFKAFQKTSYEELKVIIIGMAPYHSFVDGNPIADGLALSCSITGRLQPSLLNFYKEIENQMYKGLNLHMIKDPDLSYLAEQGVLLLNAALTTSRGKPGDHLPLWEPFMIYLFENVFITGAPIIFLGKEAGKLSRHMFPFTWHFEISHPASAAYANEEWDSQEVFKKVNKILMDNHGETIEWARVEQ